MKNFFRRIIDSVIGIFKKPVQEAPKEVKEINKPNEFDPYYEARMHNLRKETEDIHYKPHNFHTSARISP
jgi:glycerol dehydrogenase-like iron-containing ADH family enzyme